MNLTASVEVGESRVSFGTKTYELSLTRNYVSRWGMAQAVRELIQNALDSVSPFVYDFVSDDGDTSMLALTSEFTTLTPATLLLGSTSKAGSAESIGSFGEGYKIALLVLTRLGYDVEMRNGNVLWKPRFRFNSRFGEELLVIDETELSDRRNKGLTVVISGLSETDIEEIRGSCLKMQDSVGQAKTTNYGDILLERPGKLYVGSLYVCDTDLTHGYNIKPEHLKLERDRQTVDNWDLKRTTRDMWFATGEVDKVAAMIEAGVADVEYARWDSPEIVNEACYRLFREQHRGAVVAATNAELKALVEQGMQKVIVVGETYAHLIRHSPSYRAEPSMAVKSPQERMEAWFAVQKYNMGNEAKRTFREMVEKAKGWMLKS